MENQRFVDGQLSTHFIEDEFPDLAESLRQTEAEMELSAMAAALVDYQRQSKISDLGKEKRQTTDAWRLSGRIDGLRKVWRS
jgi:acetyl/propionyl-CoA carboxylase alpha subunit